jgi:hypothetical protein
MKNGAGMASNNDISHTKFCENWLTDFIFLSKESNLKTLTVIWFIQLDNSVAMFCYSLESVKQHDATYMIISSMGVMNVQ